MRVSAKEVNGIRAELGDIAGKCHDVEAMLLATVDFLAAQLAAIAQIDREEGRRQLEWAVGALHDILAHRATTLEGEANSAKPN